MAHNIMERNGRAAAAFADNPAWHGLGQVVRGAMSWQDAMTKADLNWTVEKEVLFDRTGRKIAAYGIFRSDDRQFLGAVGDQYTPIQNQYAFDFVDALLGVEAGAHYESAGALGRGERIWCLARIPHDFSIGGIDPHETYLLFTTSHDGSLAATAKITSVRVVCQNTLSSALALQGAFTRIKHTRTAEERLNRARRMMKGAVSSVKELETKLDTLSRRELAKEHYTKILDRLFPVAKKADAKTGAEVEVSSTRRDNIITNILELAESNDNNQFPEFHNTAYSLLNAVTNYTDHNRTVRLTEDRKHLTEDTARLEAGLWGTGAALKESALNVIMEETADARWKSTLKTRLDMGAAARQAEEKSVLTLEKELPTPENIIDITPVVPAGGSLLGDLLNKPVFRPEQLHIVEFTVSKSRVFIRTRANGKYILALEKAGSIKEGSIEYDSIRSAVEGAAKAWGAMPDFRPVTSGEWKPVNGN